MILARRIFFAALLFARPAQTKSVEATVLETFDIDGRTVGIYPDAPRGNGDRRRFTSEHIERLRAIR